jgi:transcription elongation factor Elf1
MQTDTTTTAKARGFGALTCPLCAAEACVTLDLDDGATFRCGDCDGTFTADEVRAVIDRWNAVLAWVDTIPHLS